MAIKWPDTGIEEADFWRYVREQIYTFPGIESPETTLTILLTGSRDLGTFNAKSDVDIDVVCPDAVYQRAHRAAIEAGLIQSPFSFFLVAPKTDWQRYFGSEASRPHVSVTSLQLLERQFREHEDVPLWIWTNAKVVHDPNRQFERIRDTFDGYPRDVLVRKMKYRVLTAWYWQVDAFPHNQCSDNRLLVASTALLNSITEMLRVFYLADGKPFPYTEQLWPLAHTTRLGRDFSEMFQRVTDMVVGNGNDAPVWQRLHESAKYLFWSNESEDCRRLDAALDRALLDAGVEPEWVKAGYNNIDELLSGSLGPPP